MATLALAVNFVSYFIGIMHYELADAANMVTNFMGVSNLLSIVVAVLADTLIGRYKTVLISGFFECLVSFHIIYTHFIIANIHLSLTTLYIFIPTVK
jgi:hypothetical protein